ncbi:hypothetical protein PtrSN002B_012272 [Pyrenophora tritici-repentis]|nr:hypothetical protein PtrSN002B_012272 [Pyrenophora tritici-repentis]PWO19737.1 Tdh, Threonine dehydrogenase [Pyrenophora tritici-repentis]
MGTIMRDVVEPLSRLQLCNDLGQHTADEFDLRYVRAIDILRAVSRRGRGGNQDNGNCRPYTDDVVATFAILQDRYAGVLLFGDNHWFKGVTDAVGPTTSWGQTWLSCGN